MWQTHIRICIARVVLIIPVAIIDFVVLRRGSGGFHKPRLTWGIHNSLFDFFLASQISISTIGTKLFPTSVWSVHFISILLSIGWIFIGVKTYTYLDHKKHRADREAERAKRKLVFDTIVLNDWTFYPGSDRKVRGWGEW